MINSKSFLKLGIPVALLASLASADANSANRVCTTVPRTQWLSLETLHRNVETVGFSVRKGELKGRCARFLVLAKTGDPMELSVDPATGTIVDGR
jgi:hypothetical protein